MKKEIFLFPNAGGTVEIFRLLCSELESEFECFCFEYPGHGLNESELLDTMDKLSARTYEFFQSKHKAGNDYVLLGYSMGTIVAMSLLKLIGLDEGTHLAGMVLAADPPKNIIRENGAETEEENIKEFYMKNGGISEKLINSKLFESLYLPSFRNDYRILKEFDYSVLQLNNDVNAIILYCEEDIPFESMQGWSKFFIKRPEFIEYAGGHFFIRKHYREIAELIKTRF